MTKREKGEVGDAAGVITSPFHFDKQALIDDGPSRKHHDVILDAARRHVEKRNREIDRLGRQFMDDNGITNPRDVTMVLKQNNTTLLNDFSHFEHRPFNDQGANI